MLEQHKSVGSFEGPVFVFGTTSVSVCGRVPCVQSTAKIVKEGGILGRDIVR